MNAGAGAPLLLARVQRGGAAAAAVCVAGGVGGSTANFKRSAAECGRGRHLMMMQRARGASAVAGTQCWRRVVLQTPVPRLRHAARTGQRSTACDAKA